MWNDKDPGKVPFHFLPEAKQCQVAPAFLLSLGLSPARKRPVKAHDFGRLAIPAKFLGPFWPFTALPPSTAAPTWREPLLNIARFVAQCRLRSVRSSVSRRCAIVSRTMRVPREDRRGSTFNSTRGRECNGWAWSRPNNGLAANVGGIAVRTAGGDAPSSIARSRASCSHAENALTCATSRSDCRLGGARRSALEPSARSSASIRRTAAS